MSLYAIGEIRRVRARNFRVATYVGDEGWMGVRTKFSRRFLDVEYAVPGYGGSVDAVGELLGCVPPEMPLSRHNGTLFALLDALDTGDDHRV